MIVSHYYINDSSIYLNIFNIKNVYVIKILN